MPNVFVVQLSTGIALKLQGKAVAIMSVKSYGATSSKIVKYKASICKSLECIE